MRQRVSLQHSTIKPITKPLHAFKILLTPPPQAKKNVCTFCGLFIATGLKQRFKKHDLLLQNAFCAGLLIEQQ